MVTEETVIDLIPGPGGRMIARATLGEIYAEHLLPEGFTSWKQDEVKVHFQRFVAPKLKAALDAGKSSPLPTGAVIRIERAEAKRAARARRL